MSCYRPISAVFPFLPDKEGKRTLIFSSDLLKCTDYRISPIVHNVDTGEIIGYRIHVPCGKCLGCRMDNSRMWSLRAYYEKKNFKDSCFVTLTFNDKYLPEDNSVSKSFIRSWLKRFRYYYGNDIKYMLCGEYGSRHGRPHYHILFYNFDFPDKYLFQADYKRNVMYFRSPSLEKIWSDIETKESYGYSIIGEVNFETCAYVARYIMKKVYDAEESHRVYYGREKEFRLNSIEFGWQHFLTNYKDYINNGFCPVIHKGNMFKLPIPRYFIEKLKDIDLHYYEIHKQRCYDYLSQTCLSENFGVEWERSQAREELLKIKLDKLVRSYELSTLLHNI